jgi:hypothetical protein
MRNEVPLAVAWYREGQWARLRELASDKDNLATTFDGWLATAERMCGEMRVRGHKIQRIDIDVEMLWAWCCAQGRALDGPARSEYVARRAQEMAAGSADG